MDAPAQRRDETTEKPEQPEEPKSVVTSHETRPGKVVLTEHDNPDGWIATDLAVDLEP
ncbi:DUF7331 family protein [Natrialbaceae archaeon A-gly3]